MRGNDAIQGAIQYNVDIVHAVTLRANCVARLQGGQKQRNQDSVASEASDVEFIRRKDYENFGAHFTAETARAHEVAATRAGNGGSLVARMEALQGACGAAPTFFTDELTSGASQYHSLANTRRALCIAISKEMATTHGL